MGAEFHADRQTDMTKLNNNFSQFCDHAKKWNIYVQSFLSHIYKESVKFYTNVTAGIDVPQAVNILCGPTEAQCDKCVIFLIFHSVQ